MVDEVKFWKIKQPHAISKVTAVQKDSKSAKNRDVVF